MTSLPHDPGNAGPTPRGEPAEWLDLYLDGLLDDTQRARFQREMESNPQLRAAVELQRRVDESIKTAFPFKQPAIVAGRIGPGSAQVARQMQPPLRLRWYAAAAVLLISAALLSLYLNTSNGPVVRYLEPAAVYARLQETGFVPVFVCKDDVEFIAAVRKRLHSGLLVSATPGVELLGWAYGNDYSGRMIGPDTMVLMARVDGKDNVVVLMDRARDDRKLKLPPGSNLSLFRREVGPIVLYEITPLKQQRVLPLAKEAR